MILKLHRSAARGYRNGKNYNIHMSAARIIVCNDDGIDSPGLRAAAEAVLGLGELVVVAPKRQQTGSGRSLDAQPDAVLEAVEFRVNGRLLEAYQADCAPARLIQHAILVFFPEGRPALLVSGINYGENIGTTLTSSGTVGAALQAASFGVPALAVSLQTGVDEHRAYGDQDWAAARHFTRLFAEKLLGRRLAPDVDVLNVNVPAGAGPQTPWRVTKASRQPYFAFEMREPSTRTPVDEGKLRITVDLEALEQGSDIHALVRERAVSVTPLSLDLTSRTDLKELGRRLAGG
jgi:5'-nucleotidase